MKWILCVVPLLLFTGCGSRVSSLSDAMAQAGMSDQPALDRQLDVGTCSAFAGAVFGARNKSEIISELGAALDSKVGDQAYRSMLLALANCLWETAVRKGDSDVFIALLSNIPIDTVYGQPVEFVLACQPQFGNSLVLLSLFETAYNESSPATKNQLQDVIDRAFIRGQNTTIRKRIDEVRIDPDGWCINDRYAEQAYIDFSVPGLIVRCGEVPEYRP